MQAFLHRLLSLVKFTCMSVTGMPASRTRMALDRIGMSARANRWCATCTAAAWLMGLAAPAVFLGDEPAAASTFKNRTTELGLQLAGGSACWVDVDNDGCEINTQNDPQNCGTCDTVCSLANSSPKCVMGSCKVDICAPPFADCNLVAADGMASLPVVLGTVGGIGLLIGPAGLLWIKYNMDQRLIDTKQRGMDGGQGAQPVQSFLPFLLVIGVVAGLDEDAVVFEGDDLVADPVEEVSIVADHKDAAREKAREDALRKLEEANLAKKGDQAKPLPEFGSAEDFQLQQALNQLKGKPVDVSKTMTERKEEDSKSQ